jgi:deazaflavin-dependent oxidoreductase (nitroreductase family)
MTVRTTATTSTIRRPPAWVTVFNPVSRFLLRAGVPLGLNGLITVPGRKSGIPRTTPVAIIENAGRRWIWAPWGEAQWARNLRAAGRATITLHRRAEDVTARELDRAERVAFFRDTLDPVASQTRIGPLRPGRWFIRTVDSTDLDDPVAAAEGRVVFELAPSGQDAV